ncbi:hypothetical protein VIGAN_05216400 [Vigna angularis var. angularis]|uniref:Uncharacterized protein n=1 Tax=Vigna angularis var. angularis TaxID=157739 RepID=A0A0S3S734_PHAAN|nr:hypothetical protein VIGAN_05216400 [Vigna angularis var. angularis]
MYMVVRRVQGTYNGQLAAINLHILTYQIGSALHRSSPRCLRMTPMNVSSSKIEKSFPVDFLYLLLAHWFNTASQICKISGSSNFWDM